MTINFICDNLSRTSELFLRFYKSQLYFLSKLFSFVTTYIIHLSYL